MDELKKNQVHTALVENWSSDGAGVCRIGGRAVFVKGAIPGETWRVRILKVTSGAVFARGEELLLPSPHRLTPDCPVYGKCGGCALRHVDYETELAFKLQTVNEAYRRIGGLDLTVGTILGAEKTSEYRNKAIYAIGDGPCHGFFRPRSHDIVAVERCLLHPSAADRAARAVCDFMARHGLPAYDERTGQGLVRHVYVRMGFRSGEALVTVVAAGGFGALTAALTDTLRRAVPEAVGIVLNVNKSRGNTVLAGEFYTLSGSDTLHDTLCGLDFALSPLSFYQVNPVQAEKLYETAVDFAAPPGTGLVLDLYCGAGTISLCLAKRAKKVIGAEIVPEAIENARRNAARNGVANVEFLCADAAEAGAALCARGLRPDAVVVDPPRKGLAQAVIDAIADMAPERVVYVSCNAATQARDLALFAVCGYTAQRAVTVDMFPRTSHIETVCLLSKLKAEHHIEVDLDLGEMDLTSAESKATYEEIKAYVLEKYGLKVSTLYISQIKRKCGLEVGQSYNLAKSENAKVPQCPPEKERAIMETLRHFGMI